MKKKRVFIVGMGSTGEEACQFIEKYDLFEVAGFAVNKEYLNCESFLNKKVYAIENLDAIIKEDDLVFVAILWNHLNANRKMVFEQLKKAGYHFANLVAPSAIVEGELLGENCWIGDKAFVRKHVKIEDNVFIMQCAFVGQRTELCAHSFVAAAAVVGGSVIVGQQSFIGLNSTVLDHTIIGEKCIVGAGTVLRRNLPNCHVVKFEPNAMVIREYPEDVIEEKLVVSENVR